MARQRRTSSVGNIPLGDNAGPALSTMQPAASSVRASAKRRRALSGVSGQPSSSRRLWLRYRELTYRNTWINPLLLMGFFYAWFYLSEDQSENHFLHKFLRLSYAVEGTGTGPENPTLYGKGPKDFAFVGFHILFFTFFREFCMQVILHPMAIYCGISKKSKISRFMEQAYSIVYYGLSGPFGLYIMYHTPIWFFNTTAFYEHYPHKTHEALFKLFYLLQASFWAQQSVVLMLQLEKPRKDFYELVFHHIVTVALIFLSYRFHFTWIGLAVYITMDISDVFLATSKTLNYLDSPITKPFFIVFAIVWIYMRHYLNIVFLWSILTEFRTVGDFELNWDTQQYKCWISQIITFGLVFALQLVNLYWLFLIFRIAWRLVFSEIAEDPRSEDDDDDDEDESSPAPESKKDQ
ncbi:sphingosine N-acyltransferase LAG1 [Sugiyamaella lignohabitans]|uniref:Sphingosine N-acyltransferase LAG1 n=1 Tax=Sugiyamaella lignohabitans TaxID=796027 RepID=A0A167DPT5_9ASCO|nr:sphingosine N-acyltransferase LAG1 [Sugiyamaella lignohabitans]ANB13148.1 sphingosine N-acyltransferase LAG1 [Sugiyamaella lignohabitans]